MKELLDDGTWRDVRLDPANDPALVRTMEQLELEAAQARVRARLQAVELSEEDAARRDHLRTRLQEVDDDFTRAMKAEAAKED
jgi:hypothetical protein